MTAKTTYALQPFSATALVASCPHPYVAIGGAGVVVATDLTESDAEFGISIDRIGMGGIFRNNSPLDAKALAFATCVRNVASG